MKNQNPSKAMINNIRKDIEAALLEVSKKNGIESINIGSIGYSADGFKVNIEGVFSGGETADMKKLKAYAPLIGLKVEIAGSEITYAKKKFKVIGMKQTNLILQDADKSYTAKIEHVVNDLKKQNSPYVLIK